MKTNVTKVWLIGILATNRSKHREIFLKAVEGFQKVALARFEQNIEAIKRNKLPERYISFDIPTDQTKDYDRVIAMLNASVGDTIELNEQDFSHYVQDNWEWKKQFIASSSNYTKVPDDEE
jgi:hypothetical protein